MHIVPLIPFVFSMFLWITFWCHPKSVLKSEGGKALTDKDKMHYQFGIRCTRFDGA